MKELCQKTKQTQAWIDALQSEQGTNVENEAEIQRLKILKKVIKPILKTQKKNLPRFKNK